MNSKSSVGPVRSSWRPGESRQGFAAAGGILLAGTVLLAGCGLFRADSQEEATAREFRPGVLRLDPVHRVTRDIQDGIETHIEEQTRLGGGVFELLDGDRRLSLALVRVHREYLSKLGPSSYFACVDLATPDGDVYDVDFFLTGEPGAMTVTETTIHKQNGQPRYVWEQLADKTWVRVDAEDAPVELLGVIRERDRFEFSYRATLPEITDRARMWLPIATSDAFQTVQLLSIDAPESREFVSDEEFGNKILFIELGPQDSGRDIEVRYFVERTEKAVYPERDQDPSRYLRAERLVPGSPEFLQIATEVTAGKEGDLECARALYDHVLDHLRYAKVGTEYGHGDAQFACDSGGGNCTDYHSYFIALARSIGIPARFAIGAAIPSSRDDGGISGYHCWAEFYSDGHWWPIDVSEADKCCSLSTFYFGRNPANRIELSRGRDLIIAEGPRSGPVNFLAYPVLEVAGQPVPLAGIDFSFRRGGDASVEAR